MHWTRGAFCPLTSKQKEPKPAQFDIGKAEHRHAPKLQHRHPAGTRPRCLAQLLSLPLTCFSQKRCPWSTHPPCPPCCCLLSTRTWLEEQEPLVQHSQHSHHYELGYIAPWALREHWHSWIQSFSSEECTNVFVQMYFFITVNKLGSELRTKPD